MTRVLILLSTWNGAQYLPPQLDSLLALDIDGELSILIRDDGSSDDTIAQITARRDARIRLLQGANLGPRGSFFELLRLAKAERADIVALCDQDDVWASDKIRRASSMIAGEAQALYASSLDLVDDQLRTIGTYRHPGNRSFAATLLSNFVTGCTCVMNRAFVEQIPFPQDSNQVIMHDWWLALVATLGARVVYDETSMIRYRQHAANHVGVRMGILAAAAKLRKALSHKPPVSRFDQARQLRLAAADRLTPDRRAILDTFLASEGSWRRRLAFVVRHRADIGAVSGARFVAFG